MRRTLIVIAAATAALSCARTQATKTAEPPKWSAALLSELAVTGDPRQSSDEERVALEAAAVAVVRAGPAMVPAILRDIESNHDDERRSVLVRLLLMIVEAIPAESDDAADTGAMIERAGERMLSSPDSSDRYAGAVLTALPARSGLVAAGLGLLEDTVASNRAFADGVLREVAGVDLGYNPDAPEEARKAAVERWQEWWAKNKDRAFYYMRTSNPVVTALDAEATAVARAAGPYDLQVTDGSGAPAAGAVVAYSYFFTTFDGKGEKRGERTTTDENGRVLLAGELEAPGMRFVGAQIVVSKAGYKQQAVSIAPHVLTPNRFSISVALESEGE